MLTSGRLLGYDPERMAFLFTLMHGARIVDCEISGAALDDLEGEKGTRHSEREAQFRRLRERSSASRPLRSSGKADRKARLFAFSPRMSEAGNAARSTERNFIRRGARDDGGERQMIGTPKQDRMRSPA